MLDELLWRCGVKKGQDLDVLTRMQTKPMWRTFMTEKCRSQTTSIPVVGTRSEEAYGRPRPRVRVEFAEENAKKMIMSDVRRHPTMMSLRGLFPVSQS